MKAVFLALAFAAVASAAEPFPELPSGPIEKPMAWRILDQQWRIIEPELFTPAGTKHIGRRVRFPSTPVSIGRPLVVRTNAGTTARVSHIPKTDMDLLRSLRRPPAAISTFVDGIITAIDPATRTITVKGFGIHVG